MMNLDVPLSHLVRGKTVLSKLAHLGLETLGDLLWYPPRRMYRWGELTRFDTLTPGADVTLFAVVMSSELGWTRRHDKAMLTVVLQDELGLDDTLWGARARRLTVRFFAKHPAALSFHAKRLEKGTLGVFAGKLSGGERDAFLAHPEYQVLEDYDPEVARELSARPQPLYHATAGLPSWKIEKLIETQLATLESVPEAIPADLREAWGLPSAGEALRWLHHPENDEQHALALDYLRFREGLTLGAALAKARSQIQARPAWGLDLEARRGESGEPLVKRFLARLPFELTKGQETVWAEISGDLARETPMNRLLQGEVGSGKTVLATLAALLAVQNGHQAAFMAPTEVLAHQHFETLTKLLGDLGDPFGGFAGLEAGAETVPLRLLTGSTPAAEKKAIQAALEAGESLLVVGTHALLSKTVKFSNLALAVVDEQHRFGVEQRVALLSSGERAPHFLAMSATPIPRTVAMTVFGDLDVSVLSELPKGRGEVKTFLVPEANVTWVTRAWARAAEEIRAGGRVYVLCAKIAPDDPAESAARGKRSTKSAPEDLETGGWNPSNGENLEELAPDRVLHTVEETAIYLAAMPVFSGIGIAVAHSGLDAATKQSAIDSFSSGETPLLVSTTVIEVGMDVPEASMMIILDADRFGLSQLHQLRGRIGRGSRPGVCLAIAPLDFPGGGGEAVTTDTVARSVKTSGAGAITPAVERLEAFASTRDGFALAEADLRIRREGDVLGATQAGSNSRLQVLSLVTDAEIIEKTKDAAAKIVNADPQLARNPELARLVFRLGDGENLTKS